MADESRAGAVTHLRGWCLLAAVAVAAAPVPSASVVDPTLFSYVEQSGAQIPADALLRDSDDRVLRLGNLANGLPLILVPAYLHCPNLCGVVRASILGVLRYADLEPGRDYVLAVLSIDPRETSVDARAAKQADLSAFGQPGAERYWHYLTGSGSEIHAVTDAVGFRNRYVPASDQFIHPAGIVFVTAGGQVSNYLLGAGYTPTDVRAALLRAGAGRIAASASPLLLVCFHFDPATGRYSLEILKVFRLAAVLTVLTLGGMLILLHRRGRTES